jgi:tetratricopeptide (TPR) repeat protein
MTRRRVFISYSTADREWAQKLNNASQEAGLSAWFDGSRIAVGDQFSDAIVRALQQASVALLLVGKGEFTASQKLEVETSLQIARERTSLRVIPVLLPQAELRHLPPQILAMRWLDLRNGEQLRREDLIRLVTQLSTDGAGPEETGDLAFERGDFDEALRGYLSALGSLDQGDRENTGRRADVLRRVAATLLALGRSPTVARIALVTALSLDVALYGDEHPAVAADWIALAAVARKLGEFGAAREHLERALAIYFRHGDSSTPEAAAAMHEMAGLQMELGDLRSARECLQRSLGLKLQFYGEEHLATAAAYHALGSVNHALGLLGDAEEMIEHSLRIKTSTLGSQHPDVAASLHNVAIIRSARGDAVTATRYLERALAVLQATVGDRHPDVATVYRSLAMVSLEGNDTVRARTCLEQALSIQRQSLGEEHPSYASCLGTLGDVLRKEGNFEAASGAFDAAASIMCRAAGTDAHPQVAAMLHNLASIRAQQGDLAAAEPLLRRVLDIESRVYGHLDSLASAESCIQLALVLAAMGRNDEAASLAQRGARVLQRLEPNHPLLERLSGDVVESITVAGGAVVRPSQVESRFLELCPYVSEIVVYGNGRSFCVALMTLKDDEVHRWAEKEGVEYEDANVLAHNPRVRDLIQTFVADLNQRASAHERIERFEILPRAFSVEEGELTVELKVNRLVKRDRSLIEEEHRELIEQMYARPDG